MRKKFLILGTILATAAVLWLIFNARPTGNTARVTVGNEEIMVLELDTDGKHEFSYGAVEMLFEVRDGQVAISASNCPDQICVREGFLERTGQMAVCLPNRAILIVE